MPKPSFSVKVFPFASSSKVKAFASLVIEDLIEVKGFKIVEGANGVFVGVPSKPSEKNGETKWYDDVVFLDREEGSKDRGEFFKEVETAMVQEYNSRSRGNSRGGAAAANAKAPTSTKKRPVDPFGDSPF